MATTITPIKHGSQEFMALAFGRAFEKDTPLSIGGAAYKCVMPPRIYRVNTLDLNNADFSFVIQVLIVDRGDGYGYAVFATDLGNMYIVKQRAEKGVDLFSDANLVKNNYCMAYNQMPIRYPRPANQAVMEADYADVDLSADTTIQKVADQLALDIQTIVKGINGNVEEIVLPE